MFKLWKTEYWLIVPIVLWILMWATALYVFHQHDIAYKECVSKSK